MLSTIIIISLVVALVFSVAGAKWEKNSYKAKPWRNPALEQEPTQKQKAIAALVSLIITCILGWLFLW